MMKGSDIGIQEKKAKLFNEWESGPISIWGPPEIWGSPSGFSKNVGDVVDGWNFFDRDMTFLDITIKKAVPNFNVFSLRVLHWVFAKGFSKNVGDVVDGWNFFDRDMTFLDITTKKAVLNFNVFCLRVLHWVFAKVLLGLDRSKSTDNIKNDKILQISSSIQKKNKVEDHYRIVKSSLNKSNCVVEPSGNANVQHSKLNTNSELICVKCNSSMFDARDELCFLEFVSDMNASSKSKSGKKAKKKEEWKCTGKVFTKIRYDWRPTGRTFTLVRNACPLTRITATNKVPLREPIPIEVLVPKTALLCLTRRTMFHGRLVFSDDELTEKELKQIKADDEAIQTILLCLPKDIYAAVDSCETAQ
nr:hypothetical protein [Tanacetum cinerariifolium]